MSCPPEWGVFRHLRCLIAVVSLSTSGGWGPLEAVEEESVEKELSEPTEKETEAAQKKSQQELEENFRRTMTNAVLEGRWYQIKDGVLGEARQEKYTLGRVTKLGEDTWIFFTRIEFGEKDVTLPVPVTVKWAGDTPVISVTNAGLPGLGTYTARVLVYDGYYAGTWSGGNHGGILSGRIVKAADSEEKAKPSQEKKKGPTDSAGN